MAFRLWGDLTAAGLAALAERGPVALLPVGAIEQHGPHLPLATDAILAQSFALEAARRTRDAEVLVLPTLSVGKSDEHLGFPGVLTLDAQTLGDTLVQIGRSVARSGVRRLVLLNAHGGNVPVLQIAARTLRIKADMFCVVAGWLSMGLPEGLVTPEEARDGVHAGFVETAAMLHFRPELVEMDKAEDFVPASRKTAEDNEVLRLLGPVSAGWAMEDLHPKGAAGNAAIATPEAGRAIAEHAGARYAVLLEEVARHPLPGRRAAP